MQSFTADVARHGGIVYVVRDAGIIGSWLDDETGLDRALEAISGFVQTRPHVAHARVAFGIGVTLSEGSQESTSDPPALGFRLARLAQPNRTLICEAAYRRAAERFDFRGVGVVVARCDPLPGPAFELLGRKQARSGTHHVGPERVPLVGRARLLRILDECCAAVADGEAIVLHVIAEPGLGKSRLLRAWLSAGDDSQRLNGWTRAIAHGVPYGSYPFRAWKDLFPSLGRVADARAAADAAGRQLRRAQRPTLLVVDDLHWVDAPSRNALAALLADTVPILAILAYRPSFLPTAPTGPARTHRQLRLKPLSRTAIQQLLDMLAAKTAADLTPAQRDDIVRKARGNPLYVEEAVAHAEAVGRQGKAARSLPDSLPELLIMRMRWTIDKVIPELERRCSGWFAAERDTTLRELERIEEQLASWLDRFDVMDEEPAQVVQRFLDGLRRIDGQLAVLSLLAGQQRPHHHRLAQALARLRRRPARLLD